MQKKLDGSEINGCCLRAEFVLDNWKYKKIFDVLIRLFCRGLIFGFFDYHCSKLAQIISYILLKKLLVNINICFWLICIEIEFCSNKA